VDTDTPPASKAWADQVLETVAALPRQPQLPSLPRREAFGPADVEHLIRVATEVRRQLHDARDRAQRALESSVNALENAHRFSEFELSAMANSGVPGLLTAGGPGALLVSPGDGTIYAGLDLDSPDLPVSHPARGLVRRVELFGIPPHIIILGPNGRPWYSATEAADLTRRVAAEYRERVAAHRRAVEADQARLAERDRLIWESSPAGRAAKEREKTAAMETRLAALEHQAAGASS
jgi:hypothetical protein